jgi:hypothetical protein
VNLKKDLSSYQKLKVLIPELLIANGVSTELDVPFEVLARTFEIASGANT